MAIAQTGVQLNFSANTAQATAQIAALENRLKSLQAVMGARVSSTALNTRGFEVQINSQVKAMDNLVTQIQRGKINYRQFMETVRGTNGLIEYQQRLSRAGLNSMRSNANGTITTGIDIASGRAMTASLKDQAIAMATASAATRAYGQTLMNLGKNMAFMGRQAMLSVTAPVLLVAAGTSAVAYQIDKQLTQIVKLSGDSSDAFTASSEQIREASMNLSRDLANNFGVAIKDTLELQGTFAALGKSGADLAQATTASARLMQLGDLDTDQAVKFGNTMQSVFGLTNDELEKSINLINEMENSTVLSMQDVADAMPKIGPIVASMGGDIRDVLVMLEALKRGGIDAVEGANAVKAVTGSVFRPTKKLQALYEDMFKGQGTWTELIERNGSNMIAILGDLGKQMESMSTPEKMKFFYQLGGKEQAARLIQLVNNLANENENVTRTLGKTEEELAGIAQGEIKQIMESVSAQFDVQVQRIIAGAQKIGSKVLPMIVGALTGVLNVGEKIFSTIGDVIDRLGPLGGFIKTFALTAAVLAAGFGPLLLLLSSSALIAGGLLKTAAGGMGLLSRGMFRATGSRFTGLQTAAQRAEQIAMTRTQTAQEAAVATTTQLTAAIDRLNAALNRTGPASTTAANGLRNMGSAGAAAAGAPISRTVTTPSGLIVPNPAFNTTGPRNNAVSLTPTSINSAGNSHFGGLYNMQQNNGVINTNHPDYAATRRAALEQTERTAASAQKVAAGMGAAALAAGLLGTQLAGTNATMQSIMAVVTGMSMLMFLFPTQIGKAFLAMGRGVKLMSTTAVSMFGATGIGQRIGRGLSSGMEGGARGGLARLKTAITGIGSTIMANAAKIGLWGMAAAAAAATLYAIDKAVTADSRAYLETLEKTNASAEAHADILGFTLMKYGQMKNEAGEVEDTVGSLAEKYSENETAAGGFIKQLTENLNNRANLNLILSQEAVKIRARGGSEEDVKKMIESALIAAGADEVTIRDLKVNFEDPDFVVNTLMGPESAAQLSDLLSGSSENQTGLYQTIKSQLPSMPGMLGGGMSNRFFGIDDEFDTADVSKTQLEDIRKQAETIVTAYASATDEMKPQLIRMWRDTLGGSIQSALDSGDEDAIKNAKDSVTRLVDELAQRDPSNFKMFNENADYQFIKESGDITTILDKVGTKFESVEQAVDAYNASVRRVSQGLGRDLTEAEKMVLMNLARSEMGWRQLNVAVDKNGKALNQAEFDMAKAAVAAGNLGPEIKDVGNNADKTNNDVEALGETADSVLQDKQVDWDVVIHVGDRDGLLDRPMTLGGYKDAMGKIQSDMFDEASRIAQENFDNHMNGIKASQDAAMKGMDAAADAMDKRYEAEEKAMSKAQDAEKDRFENDWDARMEREMNVYEDRIKAIEATQEAEDALERERKRNAEREADRLRRLADIANANIDMNVAIRSGDMDQAARIAVNQGQASIDYAQSERDREAGYKKEDDDRGRKTAIDLIKDEQEARKKMLEEQKEAEQKAMEERFEIQKEEFNRRRELERADLAARREALQQQFNDDNAVESAMFQTNQRRMQMELDTLRATLPRNTAEMLAQKDQIQAIYAKYGVDLQIQGDQWSQFIGNSMVQRLDEARNIMANEQAWNAFGSRVGEGVAQGALNMNIADFNRFIRTGEMPGSGIGAPAPRTQGTTGFGGTRHEGGPISQRGGYDKYNSRAGIPKNAPMRSDETNILAQKGEYVIKRSTHKKLGTSFLNKLNSGQLIRHEGGPIKEESYGGRSNEAKVLQNYTLEGVRHDGGPLGIGGLGGILSAGMIGGVMSRVALATGNAMMTAVTSGMSSGMEFVGTGAAKAAVDFAKSQSGKPYQYAGVGNPSWDCSGFMGAIWAILTGRNPNQRWFSTETFNGAKDGTLGMKRGIAPDYPNGFTLGFMHGGGGPNSHVAGTLLGANVESGGNGVQYGSRARNALDPQFHDHWYLPGVSGTAPAPPPGKGGFNPGYAGWTTPGIEAYAAAAMAKFGPQLSSGDGAMLGDMVTGNKAFYAKEIVEEAKRRRLDKNAAIIALMTAMQESSMLMYANSNVPESLRLPHDAVGHDHDSVGLFQQRGNGAWGSLQQRMNPRGSAGAFYNALAKFNYNGMDKGAAAQKVQVSAFPGAYSKWLGQATSEANKYFDLGGIARGIGMMPKNTLRPERVLSPAMTATFDNKLIPLLQDMNNRGIIDYDSIVNTLRNDNGQLIDSARRAVSMGVDNAKREVVDRSMSFTIEGNVYGVEHLQQILDGFKSEVFSELDKMERTKQRKLAGR